MSMTNDSAFDDEAFEADIPWASPEIRLKYEAALGRMLLAFNYIEHLTSCIVKKMLIRLGNPDLAERCSNVSFEQKVQFLEILNYSSESGAINSINFKALRDIAGERNFLAHGHFDQNPFDGSYDIINHKRKRDRGAFYSADRLDNITYKAEEIAESLRLSEAYFNFEKVSE